MKKRILAVMMVFILCGAAGSAQNKTYEVKAGETLYGIANRQNVAVDSILKWNNLRLVITSKKDRNGNPIKEIQPAIKKGQSLIVGKAISETIKVDQGKKQETQIVKEEVLKEKTLAQKTIQEDKKTEKESEKSSSWWWFWLLLGAVGSVFCWEKWIKGKIAPLFNQKETQSYQNYIDELQGDKQELKKEIEELKIKNKKLFIENNEIRKECEEKEIRIEKVFKKLRENQHIPQNVVTDIVQQTVISTKPTQSTNDSSTLYADSIIDNTFNRVVETPNEDTVYEITKTSIRTATFRIYPDAYKRVIKNPDFIDGCDKQKINSIPQTLEIENGETTQDDFGKWQITKKAKIKLV